VIDHGNSYPQPDPRDTETAALRAEVERLTRENNEARAWAKNLTDRAGFKSRAETAEARVAVLEGALTKIAAWELPTTEEKWGDGSPMSYGAVHGTNGEREFIRGAAAAALAVKP
jgi:hypothetical protein